MNQTIKNKLSMLPDQSGCYLMKDNQNSVIYVGKAKVLKNRVRSYFSGFHDDKTTKLVNQITDFEYILTSSNLEALILEMNLIKKYNPKYNIMLKDDKSYPFIKITAERNPRLIITREVRKDRGKYFGPFANVQAAYETKKMLELLYPLRKCPLSSNHACLHYQLGQCIGSCVREVSEEEYQQVIKNISGFFHGGYKKIKNELMQKMRIAAKNLDFEMAQNLHKKISSIEATMEQQNIITTDHHDRDVFGFDAQQGWICIQVFYVRQGKMIERHVSIFPAYDEEESILLTYIGQFYSTDRNIRPKEILIPAVNKDLARKLLQIRIIQPVRGQKKELVKLACKNAKISLQEKLSTIEMEEESNEVNLHHGNH